MVTVTGPLGSSVSSASVARVKVREATPPANSQNPLLPSRLDARKSAPGASATPMFTMSVSSDAGAGLAVTVKVAAVPSVTAGPPVMVSTGREDLIGPNGPVYTNSP